MLRIKRKRENPRYGDLFIKIMIFEIAAEASTKDTVFDCTVESSATWCEELCDHEARNPRTKPIETFH